MAEKQKSVFNKLNDLLLFKGGFEGTFENKEEKIIIKGDSYEDVLKKQIEVQQQEQLYSQFYKVEKNQLQKTMQYEAQRLPAFMDYEGMEYYPMIAAALDLYAEEATTTGENGKMLNIYSKSDRIKKILEDLFYDVLNINTNLISWTRTVIKYGDNMIYLLPEKGKGITMVKQLPVFEMERKEDVINNKLKVWFKRRDTGQEFTPMEIAHFRLAGDDKYYPYGSSILNKGRRTWRMLLMAEDAMLSYRILRAGEKRVFKIDIGNLDVNDIEPYIQKVATKFKRSPQINRDNGNIDHRFNILGNDEDYFIPVRNSNAGTVIDTLPGGESLDKIADIEYLRDNLFTSLGVPKPFLGYQNTAGEGKNLAQQDMRFSKKVNKIQQSIIQELNKIAIIHLYLLGFEDELDNFSLSLSSPSNQAEILKVELLTLKMQLYNEMTQAQDNGIAAASHTWAKKNILNWSEDEIIKDLENQMMERVVVQELQNATNLFAKTGIFDNIIKKYGAKEGEVPISAPGEEDKIEDGGMDFGSMGGESPTPEPGGAEAGGGGPEPAMPEMGESVRYRNNKLIMEIMNSNVKDDTKNNLLEEYKSTQDKSNQLFNKTLESIKEIDNNLEKNVKKSKK
jgi:hypothetical protein